MISLKPILFGTFSALIAVDSLLNDTDSMKNSSTLLSSGLSNTLGMLHEGNSSIVGHSRRSGGSPINYSQLAVRVIKTFYDRLRKYSSEEKFDFMTFDSEMLQAHKRYVSIGCVFREMAQRSAEIRSMLRMTKELFATMVKASAFMQRAHSSGDIFHKMTAELHELKVLSMSMINVENKTDLGITDYCAKVGRLYYRFFSFGYVYSSHIASMPAPLLGSLSETSLEIENNLKYLACDAGDKGV